MEGSIPARGQPGAREPNPAPPGTAPHGARGQTPRPSTSVASAVPEGGTLVAEMWFARMLVCNYEGADFENAEKPSEITFRCLRKSRKGTFDWMGIYI